MESKKEIYDLIPQQFYPRTLLFQKNIPSVVLLQQVETTGLKFPLIGKPDIGMRGLSVKKLETIEEVKAYAEQSKVDFLLQEFIPYENETGIFYYRFPNESSGHISGIVGKEFVTVTGNGKSTIEELLQKDQRFILQLQTLRNVFGDELKRVLPANEKMLLVPYGNHSRGSKFLDDSHLIDEQLTRTIDSVCQQIPGFYFGRMDIRYHTWEELKQGKNFSIIELNGAGSEPTHMYDPRHSIFFAWKEIIRHWHILLKISMQNHRTKQIPYMSLQSGLEMFKENSSYVKMIGPG